MRGMMKWLPFKSLKEQDDMIERVKRMKRKRERPELSEDGEEAIDRTLSRLRKGDRTRVTFFYDGEIFDREDVFLFVNPQERRIYFLGFSLTLGNLLGLEKA